MEVKPKVAEKGSKNAKMKKKGKKAKVKIYPNKKRKNNSETNVIDSLKAKYESINIEEISTFNDVPLSAKTLKGLKQAGYTTPTEIQKETIGLGLQGKDILGAAKTGSGKTLAFLIPILEVLYCNQWTNLDGLGALVITPTRELAYQIFETLRKVGVHHDFSAGLIIGGKDLHFEKSRMDQCNIVICTPGRLLQHMDTNPLFDCVNLKVLVLDEADRCLDMGFQQTMNAIIENLPLVRQTLLFSATQTKSVKDLARLSLKDPAYVSVHENAKHSTPAGLEQSYVICNLEDKLSIIWSFIRNHLKQKCIIFFSSCKQVKYMYEIFCKLRPGVSLLALYGTLHQLRRMDIYEDFCNKTSAILFATDLAARGLDFPQVHWVVQADCPEDADTYIHRVGRTARYQRGGESLLMLLPTETAILANLTEKKIPIAPIEINPKKLQNPVRKMEAYLAKDPQLKDSGQRAFVSYVKATFLMRDKKVFKVNELDTDSFAKSLGLTIPPRIRFLQRMKARLANQVKKEVIDDDDGDVKNEQNDGSGDDSDRDINEIVKQEDEKTNFHVSDDSDSDDMLKVKRKDHDIELPTQSEIIQLETKGRSNKKPLTKAAYAKMILKKKIQPNKKIVFDDDGDAVQSLANDKKSGIAQEYENEEEGGIDIEKAKLVLKEEDKVDRQMFKQRVKAKHKEEKRKLKEKKKKDAEEEEDKDDFGTDSESEPDLSWLPDPDKIYNQKNTSEDLDEQNESAKIKMQESDGEEAEDNSALFKSKSKRKLSIKTLQKSSGKKRKFVEKVGENLSINDAEELAMMLLQNK